MDVAAPERRTLEEPEERTVVGHALVWALARAPLWLTTYGAQLFLAALPAYAVYLWFGSATANRYAPGALLHHPDVVFRTDHDAALGRLHQALGGQLAFSVLVSFLLGVFFAGGWLQIVLERTQGQSIRRFLYGGARYFWRFLRLLLVSLLVLALARWVLYGLPWNHLVLGAWLGVPEHDRAALETLASEQTVRQLTWLREGLFALCFALVLTWGDYTRTRLALQDTGSTLWAGLLTFFTMLRHPIRTLRPMLALLLIEGLILVGISFLVRWIGDGLADAASWWRVAAIFLLFQLAILPRHIIRGARYAAAATVSKEIVRPLFRPDPWKDSIGGPGGPRYPLEEGDEYGVSL
jgi:hypothetical protein